MKCVKRQKKKHQLKLIPLIKQKINSKKIFPLDIWSSWIGQESMLVWHLERNIAFKINKDDASSAWNSSISNKIFLRHSQQISEQKFLLKRLLKKPSMLVWHGQNCDRSQIKTKRVGAWPLCFFFIVTYIFDVFNFSFAPSRRKKIFFWWCHTNMHGTNLRSSPLL